MPRRTLHNRFIYLINERENIRIKKERGDPPPWTEDPVLREFKFTNIVRREDRLSRWINENWYEPFYNHENMVLAVTLARFFNFQSTLETIGFPEVWDPDAIVERVLSIKGKLFNIAYRIAQTAGKRTDEYYLKRENIVRVTANQLVGWKPNTDSMEETHRELQNFRHFGSFMAGQVVADFRIAIEGEWKDRLTWAPLGPGSKKGMKRYLRRPLDSPLGQKEFEYHLKNITELSKRDLPEELTSRMEAHDWQGCFCEFDKYQRASMNEGFLRQKYYPFVEKEDA